MLLFSIYIFDTTSTKLIWEHPYYPQYYLPETALQQASLKPETVKAAYSVCSIVVGSKHARDAAIVFRDGPLAGYVRLDFGAMEGWFEEGRYPRVHLNISEWLTACH